MPKADLWEILVGTVLYGLSIQIPASRAVHRSCMGAGQQPMVMSMFGLFAKPIVSMIAEDVNRAA